MSKSLTQWQSYIGTSLRKTAEATLETAKRIAEYRETTKESEFNKTMHEWFNFSPSHLSYWTKINEALPRFQENIDKLPASMRTLYELSNIKDELWAELIEEGKLTPSLTIDGVKQFKMEGNILKKLSEKYSDADNYFEIMQAASEMRKDKTKEEFKKEFDKWIKKNPPVYAEAAPAEVTYEPIEGDYIPNEEPTPIQEEGPSNPNFEELVDDWILTLEHLSSDPDFEKAHIKADDVLCDALETLGYPELVKAYTRIDKKYA